jgi:hypothetical protein
MEGLEAIDELLSITDVIFSGVAAVTVSAPGVIESNSRACACAS